MGYAMNRGIYALSPKSYGSLWQRFSGHGMETQCRWVVQGYRGKREGVPMSDKPTLYVDYERCVIQGPYKIIGRLFANPKAKSWFGPPESTIVISNPEQLCATVERLRELGYPLVEHPLRPQG